MEPIPFTLLTAWEAALGALMERTARFPRSVRFTLGARVDNVAIDVLERLIEARYDYDRAAALRTTNLDLEKLRVLLRVAHRRGFIDHAAFEQSIRDFDEVGSMVGGWIRSLSHDRSR